MIRETMQKRVLQYMDTHGLRSFRWLSRWVSKRTIRSNDVLAAQIYEYLRQRGWK